VIFSHRNKSNNYIPTNEAISTYTTIRDYYSYDALNRISYVEESQQSTGGVWTTPFHQQFSYDRWGNRTLSNAATWGLINNAVFSVDQATNRLVPGSGTMSYDAAGNLTQDTYTRPGSGVRSYDGESRLISAPDTNGNNTYVYDAEGRRTRRIVGAVETWQLYGMGGEMLAGYPAQGAAGSPQKEYGYRDGQ